MGNKVLKFELKQVGAQQYKFPCKECRRETSHKIISCYSESGSEGLGGGHTVDWNIDHQIIQCLGCEDVSFRTSSTNSEDFEPDYDEERLNYYETVTYYPGRVVGTQLIEHWSLPWTIGQIYKETRSAVENELFIIAGVAIRVLVESICKDVGATGRNLDKKIDDLHARSLVTKEGVETLHKVRNLGNRAAHEAKAHTKDQLLLALEVVEHILIGTYLIPERVKVAFKNIEGKALSSEAPELPAPQA